MCCGNRQVAGRHYFVNVPSLAALTAFRSVNAAPPCDPDKFALRLLTIFFSAEELASSNCTKADGRSLLNPNVLLAIKCKIAKNNTFDNIVGVLTDERTWHIFVIVVLLTYKFF